MDVKFFENGAFRKQCGRHDNHVTSLTELQIQNDSRLAHFLKSIRHGSGDGKQLMLLQSETSIQFKSLWHSVKGAYSLSSFRINQCTVTLELLLKKTITLAEHDKYDIKIIEK